MSPAHIRIRERDILRFVEKIWEKRFTGSVIGVHTETEWTGPSEIASTYGTIHVRYASTLLAFRAALMDVTEDTQWMCILTPLTNDQLPADVRSHLVPYYNLVTVDSAETLRVAFAATTQFPGVAPNRSDIPQLLAYLDSAAAYSGRPLAAAPAGVLTTEHLHTQIVSLGLSQTLASKPSVESLVEWSLSPHAEAQWERFTTDLPESIRRSTLAWLRNALGSDGGAALDFLIANGPRDLLLYGLIAEILVPSPYEEASTRHDAETRFKLLADVGTTITEGELKAWSGAAVGLVAQSTDENRHRVSDVVVEAQDIIISPRLGGAEILHLSSVCGRAFDERLNMLADALSTTIGEDVPGALPLYDALAFAKKHLDATRNNQNVQGAEAAVRLLQWRAFTDDTDLVAQGSLSQWLSTYRTNLSWVDTCVNQAWSRSSHERLSSLTTRIASNVLDLRRSIDRAFANVAKQVGAHRAAAAEVLLIEDFLDSIVQPLNSVQQGASSPTRSPVLVVVLDGMSVPSSNSLITSVLDSYRGTWREVVPEVEHLSTALAVYPTVTTKSRASLLSGELTTGGQNVERDGLNKWYARTGSAGSKPLLLHKADLDLSDTEVATFIENTDGNPLVVAVLNTIDDALDKSDPLDRQWSIGDITHLEVLMQAAARVGRTVVFVSDHGHIVERRVSSPVPGGGTAARWRPAASNSDNVEAGEVYVSGERVLTDNEAAILAVDEDLRYTARKSGYHGGLSLAEAAIPVTILTQEPSQLRQRLSSSLPVEVTDSTTRYPSWWKIDSDFAGRLDKAVSTESTASGSTPDAIGRSSSDVEVNLLDLLPADDASEPASRAVFGRLSKLEKNAAFQEQVKRYPIPGSATAPSDVADLVRVIAAEGKRPVTTEQLQKILGLSIFAVRGTVAKLQQILNMDGVEVLVLDGTDLSLNTPLLETQFGLDA